MARIGGSRSVTMHYLFLALPVGAVLTPGASSLVRSVGLPRAHVFAQARPSPKPKRAGERQAERLASGEEPSLATKGAWYATELFGKLAAIGKPASPALNSPAGAPKTLREAISRLEADYERRYFIIGQMDEALYADDCEFADAFTSFKGKDRFVANLANLAGGFITDSRVRTLSAEMSGSTEAPAYTTRLLVQLQLALPWKPLLAWVWGVTHEFDPETLLVVRHVERWEVSAAEGVRQLLTPGPVRGLEQGRPSAPDAAPTAQGGAGREAQRAAPQLDPVLGPLVRLARSSGLLQAEADGWEGEPTAWAQPDSLAQRLSQFTATRLKGLKQAIVEASAGEFDPVPVDARIASESQSAPVFLYSFSSCPFCKRAKELLAQEGAAFTALELDTMPEGPAIRARLGKLTGRTSMPAIWVGGEYIGGCNDGPAGGPQGIASLARSGELVPMLVKAGALKRAGKTN